MRNISTAVRTCVLVSAAACVTIGCQPSRRGAEVGTGTADIAVTLNNLIDKDKGRFEYQYEMRGCGANVSGNLGESDLVVFKTQDVKAGMNCEVLVMSSAATNDQHFKWLGDSGVLYWAKNVLISQSSTGVLSGQANLQRVYDIAEQSTFRISADVVFPESMPGRQIITAQLVCTSDAKVLAIGTYLSTDATTGKFLFVENIGPTEKKDYECVSVDVFTDGDGRAKFRGTVDDAHKKFQGALNATPKLAEPALTLVKLVVTPPGGDPTAVDVSTVPKTCAEDEVFDTVKRVCIKKR